jgi:hypothetical protein
VLSRVACCRGQTQNVLVRFAPPSIPGLKLWLRADQDVWQDDLTPAAQSDDPVALWKDQSGLGHNLTQSNGTKLLSLQLNARGRLPSVSSDGLTQYLQTSGLLLATPYTLVLAFRDRSSSLGRVIHDSTVVNKRVIFAKNTDTAHWGMQATGGTARVFAGADTNWHLLLEQWNGASSKYKLDNGAVTPLSGSPGSQPLTGFTLGAAYNGTAAALTDFGEVLIYSGTLSASLIAQLFAYLNERWQIY